VVVVGVAMGHGALAQSLTASGGVGVGVIADSPATVVEAGLDVAGPDATLGLGGRLSLLADGGLRTEDWDQPSEWATLIRYLTYRRPAFEDELQVSLAAGELTGAALGYGGLIEEYSSGIDIDHRHLGVQARVFARTRGASFIVDDLVAPRIAGARAYLGVLDRFYVGASVATDLEAPSEGGNEAVVGGAVDLAMPVREAGRDWWLEGYAQLAGWAGLGGGAHLGVRGATEVGPRWIVQGRIEGRAGSGSYLPGYIGALYERNRFQWAAMSTQLDQVRSLDLAGVGGAATLLLQGRGLGSAELSAAHRAGLGARAGVALTAAERQAIQLGVRGVFEELGPGASAWIAASELRWRLPAHLYATAQAARLYRRQDDIAPAWWVVATLGAVIGE